MSRWQSDEWDVGDSHENEGDEELGAGWELDPNDPSHPDYDLSESSGYLGWEPSPKPVFLRRGVVLLITILVLIGLLIPLIVRLTY